MADEYRKPLIVARRTDHHLTNPRYTVRELADRYGVTASQVRSWIEDGFIGKEYRKRVTREAVLEFEDQNLVIPADPEAVEAAQAANEALRRRAIDRRRNRRSYIEEYLEGGGEAETPTPTYDDPDARFDELVFE